MIDLKKFRENPEPFIEGVKNKGYNIDFDKFIELDKEVRQLKTKLEELQSQKNTTSKKIEEKKKNKEDMTDAINEMKELKDKISSMEEEYKNKYEEFRSIYISIPNIPFEDVPVGNDEDDNIEIGKILEQPKFDFQPLTHDELLKERDLMDTDRAAKVSGTRFYYLRDGLVRLELALANWVMTKLSDKGFRPTTTPHLVREKAMEATGFFPAEKNEIYNVNPEDDNLFLVGTSEVSLVAQHMDENIERENLPLRYVGFTPCYRREAGTYGKDTRGIIRVHQFEKLEMVSFINEEDSQKEHQFYLDIQEEIFKELGLHFRKIAISTGDMGTAAARQYDLEGWRPVFDDYKEITSCSNCTDYQARRANIKWQDNTDKGFVHTLNGTAISMQRALALIVENFQTEDRKIKVPDVLRPYLDEEYI